MTRSPNNIVGQINSYRLKTHLVPCLASTIKNRGCENKVVFLGGRGERREMRERRRIGREMGDNGRGGTRGRIY